MRLACQRVGEPPPGRAVSAYWHDNGPPDLPRCVPPLVFESPLGREKLPVGPKKSCNERKAKKMFEYGGEIPFRARCHAHVVEYTHS